MAHILNLIVNRKKVHVLHSEPLKNGHQGKCLLKVQKVMEIGGQNGER